MERLTRFPREEAWQTRGLGNHRRGGYRLRQRGWGGGRGRDVQRREDNASLSHDAPSGSRRAGDKNADRRSGGPEAGGGEPLATVGDGQGGGPSRSEQSSCQTRGRSVEGGVTPAHSASSIPFGIPQSFAYFHRPCMKTASRSGRDSQCNSFFE